MRTPTAGEHVRTWEALYDDVYSTSLTDDPRSRFAGWNSSYTGEPIPIEQMEEWRDATVRRIGELAPRRVLELGVGSGLLLTELAWQCDSYWGVDVSGAVIDWLEDRLDDLDEDVADRVVLRQGAAHELADLPEGLFDTVVLNSVVQYFPDTGYLREVVDGAFRLLAPGGAVFIGDVRDPRTYRCFQAAVADAGEEAGEDADDAVVLARAERAMSLEKELLVDPAFFAGLPYGVDLRVKEAKHHNELSRHRYDVILTQEPRARVGAARELVWGVHLTDVAELREHLAGSGDLRVTGIPNLRLTGELTVLARLESRPPPPPGVDPWELAELAAGLGHRVRTTLSEVDDGSRFDAFFTRADESTRSW